MNNLYSVYATSLFSVCIEEKKLDKVFNNLCLINNVFKENKGYFDVLSSHRLTKEEKELLIDNAFKRYIDIYTLNFLKLLCSKNILYLFDKIEKEFCKKYYKFKNIEKVTVITAIELSEKSKKKLKESLEKHTGKKIIMDLKLDSQIIGGMIIKFENSIIDLSIKQKLDSIEKYVFSQ